MILATATLSAMSPAAYANAIHNATGIRFYGLPVTPEKVLAALAGQKERSA